MQGFIAPFVTCVYCNGFLNFESSIFVDFMQHKSTECPTCQKTINWFDVVKKGIFDNFMENAALGYVGCNNSIFNFVIEPNTPKNLDFENYGIPSNARILFINYTPQGGNLFPIEMHSNTSTLRFKKNKVLLYPRPFHNGEQLMTTTVSVLVSWFVPNDFDSTLLNLLEAFEEYIHGNYLSVFMPANVAIENTIYRIMDEFLKEFASVNKVEEFLTNNATYGHQLSILLPMFLSIKKQEKIPDSMMGNLSRLRKLRNEYAHNGKIENLPSKYEIAEILTSCLFIFHYMQFLYANIYKK